MPRAFQQTWCMAISDIQKTQTNANGRSGFNRSRATEALSTAMTDLGDVLREEAAELRLVGMDDHAALIETLAYNADLRAAERQALHRLCETLLTTLGEMLEHVPGVDAEQ